MYKILGSDGNEYGPVSAEQVKKWIAENRVEKKTPVIPEGASDWVFLESLPEFAADFGRPASGPPPLPHAATALPRTAPKSDEVLSKIIPYKNTRALMAYYLGIFSVIPLLGAPPGIAAFFLGIAGLRFRRQHPEAGGAAHAWIGIILGSLFGFGYSALIIAAVTTVVVQKHSMH